MKNKLNPALAGMFLLGALLLIVAALLSFRSIHLFSKPGRFVAYFDEPVQGLDVGGAVKLRGVLVGRVVTIRVRYDAKTWPAPVAVGGELDNNAITDAAGQTIKLTDRATLQRLVEEGLRAKLELVGITGQQFVQLDFLDPRKSPAPPANRDAECPVVPTVASQIHELMANFSKIVSDLKKADFAEEAVKTLQQVKETAQSLQQLADFLERNPNALITGKKRPNKEP